MITKEWGFAEPVIQQPLMEASKMHMARRSFCSWHSHLAKWNAFVVIEGMVQIQTGELLDDEPWDAEHVEAHRIRTTSIDWLQPGQVIAVPPAVIHRVYSPIPSQVLEWYWPGEVSAEDIYRFSKGGSSDV